MRSYTAPHKTGKLALLSEYKKKKSQIRQRLSQFKKLGKAKDEDIFAELCFCILTPQSKAVYCDRAIKDLKESGLLLKGKKNLVRSKLKGVRFPNNKTSYLLAARNFFKGKNCQQISKKIKSGSSHEARNWLAENVKGLGYKEASHFLRNIGLGRDLAILDTHILKNLKRYGVIKKIPSSISRKKYAVIENKMKDFSKKIGIPLEELDLLFWSNQTGFIFK